MELEDRKEMQQQRLRYPDFYPHCVKKKNPIMQLILCLSPDPPCLLNTQIFFKLHNLVVIHAFCKTFEVSSPILNNRDSIINS